MLKLWRSHNDAAADNLPEVPSRYEILDILRRIIMEYLENVLEAEDLCWRILLIGDNRKGLDVMWNDLAKLMGSYEEANRYFIAFMWRRGTGG